MDIGSGVLEACFPLRMAILSLVFVKGSRMKGHSELKLSV
jgi:hypothetical protein